MSDQKQTDRIVYVQRTMMKLGVASTARTATSETYYEAFLQPDGQIKLVLLDINDKPTAITEIVTAEILQASYEPCPDFFATRKTPQQKTVAKQLAVGREHLRRKEFHTAEYEFDKVIKIDDRNLEAHLGKGESLIGQGDVEGAKVVLDKISEFDELYDKKNKHILNAFGITLRQGGFHQKAVDSFRKALQLDPQDENLYFNMARTYYETGQYQEAVQLLEMALHLKPGHPDAQDLLRLVKIKQKVG